MDPILETSIERFTTFPIKYNTLWRMYKNAVATFWTVEEIDLSKDYDDFKKLTHNEQHFIKNVLAFFASSDGIVFENIDMNFGSEVQIPEARSFYAYQGFNEMIHGETYSLLIDTLVKDVSEKAKIFNAIETMPCVKRKCDWAMKYMNTKQSFATRLVAFACVEGIFFSGSFCAIYWIKRKGLMNGLCFSNELISRDEGMHQTFAVELHNTLKEHCKDIQEIVNEAVEIEREFIVDSLPCSLIGMNSDSMYIYIQYVADRLLVQLGQEKFYNVECPFPWMENISMEGKTNFFEKRVSEYNKHVQGSISFDSVDF
jgi:ribonucleotide reductase beta subunit family protein with ferritin-like domain